MRLYVRGVRWFCKNSMGYRLAGSKHSVRIGEALSDTYALGVRGYQASRAKMPTGFEGRRRERSERRMAEGRFWFC